MPSPSRETGPALPHEASFRAGAHAATTTRHLTALVQWGRRLIAQERPEYSELLPLFARVHDEITSAASADRLLPTGSTPATATVDSPPEQADAGYFVEGLTAARVLVWVLHDNRSVAERLPRLVVAALLQDVGRMFAAGILRRLKGRSASRAEWLECHHPSVGAALLAGVHRAPVELPLLVAQHHERLDGGGFPGALVARELTADAAILAAATRFAQLCLASRPHDVSHSPQPAVLSEIARVLFAEAKWGMWPVDFAIRVRERIAAIQEVPPVHDDAIRPATVDRFERDGAAVVDSPDAERHRRLDPEEEVVRGMHAGAGEPFAATTLEEIRRFAGKKLARSE